MKSGIELIAAERKRQVEVEGWTAEHDRHHDDGDLALAAALLIVNDLPCWLEGYDDTIAWYQDLVIKHENDRQRQLVIAGALIAAEIDRIQRLV